MQISTKPPNSAITRKSTHFSTKSKAPPAAQEHVPASVAIWVERSDSLQTSLKICSVGQNRPQSEMSIPTRICTRYHKEDACTLFAAFYFICGKSGSFPATWSPVLSNWRLYTCPIHFQLTHWNNKPCRRDQAAVDVALDIRQEYLWSTSSCFKHPSTSHWGFSVDSMARWCGVKVQN